VKNEKLIETPNNEIAGKRHKGQKIVKFPKIKPVVPAVEDEIKFFGFKIFTASQKVATEMPSKTLNIELKIIFKTVNPPPGTHVLFS